MSSITNLITAAIGIVSILSVLGGNVNQENITPTPELEKLGLVNSQKDQSEAKIIYRPNKNNHNKNTFIEPQDQTINFRPHDPFSEIDSLLGFQSSSIDFGSNLINVRDSFTVTIPEDRIRDASILSFYPEAEFEYTIDNSTITVYPKLDRLQTYIFGLKDENICFNMNCQDSEENWIYALKFSTDYKDEFVYGTSVEGRDLNVSIFGTNDENGTKIMFTGGIHGSEWRSGDLTQFIEYLKDNPNLIIDKNLTLIIAPFTNPDGTIRNIRYNANGVNLNRNWPDQWEYAPTWNRGSSPLSEPESKHLYDLTIKEMPDHILSYHAQWPPYGIIFLGDNSNPNTVEFARWVSDNTGYPLGIHPADDSPTGDIGGDQCVWANSIQINCLIIEATYVQNSDWDKNFPMYKALISKYSEVNENPHKEQIYRSPW